MTVHQILEARGKTHGDYPEVAEISQSLKGFMQEQPGWKRLDYGQREALDMIAMKIARVLSGDPKTADHWDDIAGYATLVSREIKVDARPDCP